MIYGSKDTVDWIDRHTTALAKVAPLVDRQLSPLGLATIGILNPCSDEVILDIGCGAGQTLSQIARHVGPGGRVIGNDISALLLSVAQERFGSNPAIEFIKADAQALALPDGSIDGAFSRFGVMGFKDPASAFSNFRRMLRPGGRIAFCCWRALEENEIDHFPISVAKRVDQVQRAPFSFADPEYLRDLLEKAGFEDITIVKYDEPVSCGGLDDTVEVLLSVGALGQMVRADPDLRSKVEPDLRVALSARSNPASISLIAAVWIVSASVAD
ncbi:class I SAM-dependent methyltransferase [Roseibium sp. MMSF_3544]|uniref:class I SAM-dependent methyltransferase n=1 Tax=unclassified Roseibium TaxID=2629323 RepID=UPI00273D4CF5|nr:class I SAM-dependent methyltransferase [Roseibium sp. MMSF_3544]